MVIGICGSGIGAGKSTLARQLAQRFDLCIHPFAAKLKEAVVALDPMLEGGKRLSELGNIKCFEEHKRDSPELRRILQRMGTEVGRNVFDEDFWVQLWAHFLPTTQGVVADDVRFENEANFIRKLGGILVFVQGKVLPTSALNSHASEQQADKLRELCHLEIFNQGTLLEYHAEIIRAGNFIEEVIQ